MGILPKQYRKPIRIAREIKALVELLVYSKRLLSVRSVEHSILNRFSQAPTKETDV